MGRRVLSIFQVEARRLLWLIALTFAVILLVHYIDIPSENILSSLPSASKVLKRSPREGNLSSNSRIIGNVTSIHHLNSSRIDALGSGNYTGVSERDHGTGWERSDNSAKSNGFQEIRNINGSFRNSTEPRKDSREDANDSATELAQQRPRDPEKRYSAKNVSGSKNPVSPAIESSDNNVSSPPPVVPIGDISLNNAPPVNWHVGIRSPVVFSNSSLVEKDKTAKGKQDQNFIDKHYLPPVSGSLPFSNVPREEKLPGAPEPAVIPISEMNKLLLGSRSSYHPTVPEWSSPVDEVVLCAKSQIESTAVYDNDPELYPPVYRNVSLFERSYELMEKILKVYIYREGEKPIFHQPRPGLKGIYASEAWFMKLLEANKKFVTKNPRKAHLFYLPFSSWMLVDKLYVRGSHSHDNLIEYLKKYVDTIAARYPFWNRTGGADHFLVACHDWAAHETKQHMGKCIRALCNADMKEGFVFGKDVSLPETNVLSVKDPLKDVGGNPPSKRSILAFFAGGMHGYLRPRLLQYWGNKDPDMKFFDRMPQGRGKRGKKEYIQHMKSSKYCICPRGYEVNSPRVVEAIFYECVPVIISDNFIPPFFDVLNWESFAVFVLEKDIPNLKDILLSIPEKRYYRMQLRVKRVQKHFLWHAKPVKYDIFHMILHSVWYQRFLQIRPRKLTAKDSHC